MLWQKTLALFILLSFSFTPQVEIPLAEALDDAGMQRTLTQTIAKNYLLEGIYPNSRQYARQREQSEALFETKLKKLRTFADESSDVTLRALLVQIQSLWAGYRQIINQKNAYENAKTVIQASNNLLHICDQVVAHIDEIGIDADVLRYLEMENDEKLSYINMAGQQRTCAQRIAMCLAARRLGIRDIDIGLRLETAINAFDEGLRSLYAATRNSAETDELIGQAIDQWRTIKESLLQSESAKLKKADFESFNELMKRMDNVVYRYEQALEDRSISQK